MEVKAANMREKLEVFDGKEIFVVLMMDPQRVGIDHVVVSWKYLHLSLELCY
jgi:hypothetical protein